MLRRPAAPGARPRRLTGTVQNDILKEYIARGTYIYPLQHSLRLVTDLFAWSGQNLPWWNPISISGYHCARPGRRRCRSSPLPWPTGVRTSAHCGTPALDVERAASRFSFFFAAHNDFFEEVAKFRAARRLWARLLRGAVRRPRGRAQALRFHTQTAGSTLTAQQPENNLARTALQALSAVLGGTQSLHVNGYDEALATAQRGSGPPGAAHATDTGEGVRAWRRRWIRWPVPIYVESLTTAIEQAGARVSRAHRCDGWDGGRDRTRLGAAGN